MKRASILVVAAATVAAWARPSEACVNPVKTEVSKAVRIIAQAEKHVADGEHQKALDLIDKRKGFRHGAPFPLLLKDKALERKGTLILATALIRLPDRHGAENGLRHLEGLVIKNEDSPLLDARIAEGRARSSEEGERQRALATLNDLDKRDLIPDAETYAVLSALRKQAQDVAGAADALDKCARMAKRKGVCPEAEEKGSK